MSRRNLLTGLPSGPGRSLVISLSILLSLICAAVFGWTDSRNYLLSALHPWPELVNIAEYERGNEDIWHANALAEYRARYQRSLAADPRNTDLPLVLLSLNESEFPSQSGTAGPLPGDLPARSRHKTKPLTLTKPPGSA